MTAIRDVLVVDDGKDWQARLQELVGPGFIVDIASSREQAISLINQRFYYFALVDIRHRLFAVHGFALDLKPGHPEY